MEEQNEISVGAETGGDSVKDEIFEQEEDQDDLPHSEILDIFEEGLAQLVQDPLLCDLPIQVGQTSLDVYVGLMGARVSVLELQRTDVFLFDC